MANAQAFLTATAASLRRLTVKLDRLDGNVTEQDIAGRRLEAAVGQAFAKVAARIEAALKATKSNQRIDQWVKTACGCDIRTMQRRKRLHKCWKEYEAKRRELGQCGQTGLLFALSLVTEAAPAVMNRQALSVRAPTKTTRATVIHSAKSTTKPIADDRCQFITGDALIELPKLKEKSVHTVVTSPAYWPLKRIYSGKGIGFEKTLSEYLENLVAIFGQVRRVLRDDGIAWINIADSYQDGDLLFIPSRLAMALQGDGWICRSQIVWQKTNMRPESVADRPSKDYEVVLMFTKKRNGYRYDTDPIRVPLKRPYSTGAAAGHKKRAMLRRDADRTERFYSNPLGRNSGSVWTIVPSGYRGSHAATMPEDLVRKCLLVSCPENGLVLDPFGGAATTALVALELGHRAISIEISPVFTKEGRERVGR